MGASSAIPDNTMTTSLTINIESSVIMIIVALVVLGFLLGALRGLNRSIFRVILTILAIAVAYFAKDVIAFKLITLEIEGSTLMNAVLSEIPLESEALTSLMVSLFEIIFGIIAFILSVIVLHFVSWILFGIFQLIIPKGEKRRRLLGGLVGAIGGLVLSLSLVLPANGLLVDAGKLTSIDFGGEGDEQVNFAVLDEYVESSTQSTLTSLGNPFYSALTTVTTENGKLSLSSVVDSISATVKIATNAMELQSIDIETCVQNGDFEDLKIILGEIDDYKEEIDDVILVAISEILQEMMPNADVQISAELLKEVSFADEVVILEDIYAYSQDINANNINTVIEDLANSHLILPIAESSQVVIELPAPQKEQAIQAINALDDGWAKDALLKLVGAVAYPQPQE